MKQLFDVLRLLALGAAAAFGQTKIDIATQARNVPSAPIANTVVLTGTGNPNGPQRCAVGTQYTVYIDTASGEVWHCTAANVFRRMLDTSGAGPFAATGTFAIAPIATPVPANQFAMQAGATGLEYATGSVISRTVVPRTCSAGTVASGIAADGTVTCTTATVTLPVFVDQEAPTGTINGTNALFTLANAPAPASSLNLYRNGVLQRPGSDYALSGASITFMAGAVPQIGDTLAANYRR